ncbi:MAG: EamA family transporter RarD [Psychrobacter sp.]|nr:EamA family transporter RarD [Psychrobacter sp.]
MTATSTDSSSASNASSAPDNINFASHNRLGNPMTRGVLAAIVSNLLFSILFLFGVFLQPLSGTQVAGWRMIMMLLSLIALVSVLKQWQHVWDYLRTLKSLKDWLLFILPTPILGGQIWLFMWGPVNGLGLDVTLGYFLYPLVMIVIGRFFYGEAMSRLQWLATGVAALGILHDVLQHGSISWATLFVCLGYPPYYLMRRKLAVPPITGLLSDLTLLLPVVVMVLIQTDGIGIVAETPRLWYLLPILGLISTAAMALTMTASRYLPVSLFGTLSYLEPVFLFIFSVTILAEITHQSGSVVMYGMIMIALLLMMLDGALGYYNRKYNNQLQGYNEPQIETFPTRRRLNKRRIEGMLNGSRFRLKRRQQSSSKKAAKPN